MFAVIYMYISKHCNYLYSCVYIQPYVLKSGWNPKYLGSKLTSIPTYSYKITQGRMNTGNANLHQRICKRSVTYYYTTMQGNFNESDEIFRNSRI
jgi:hypothetical protein